MFDIFGEFDSAEEINLTAVGLLGEGDMDNIRVLAKENGLEDMAEIFLNGGMEKLTDTFMAAVGKLNVEKESEDVKKYSNRIPAEPIVDYLLSRCDEEEVARSIRKMGKSLKNCLEYVEKEARKIVTKEKPYLADMTVFLMALDYYTM